MKNEIEINLLSFPKHKAKLFDNNKLKAEIEIDCGWSFANELLSTGSVFEDIKIKRTLKSVEKLFEPTKITIKAKK